MINDDPKLLAKLGQSATIGPLRSAAAAYQIFHENSKFNEFSSKIAGLRIAAIGNNKETVATLSNAYKVYSMAEAKPLEIPEPTNALEQSIHDRRSIRQYTGEPLGLEQLSRLLFFTYGRTQKNGFFRAVASGGGLYPLELYVFSFRVDGLEPGLYHYAPQLHGLDLLKRGDHRQPLERCIFLEDTDLSSSCMVVAISAVFVRSTIKYGDRGYRMTLMECGEAGHNLSLMATSMRLGCVWIGGFLDDRLNELLEIDGVEESVLVPIVVGKRV